MIIYVTPHNLNNLQIPTRVQVHYASTYCASNGLPFSLPVSESLLEQPYKLFSELITQANHPIDFIIFSRLYLATSEVRHLLADHTLSGFGAHSTFYFTYDDIVCSAIELLRHIDMVLRYRRCAKVLPLNWSNPNGFNLSPI